MAIDKITADGIADNAIGTSKIGADVIVAEDIAANAITVSEIQDDAVTSAKLNLISTNSVPSLEAKGDGSSIEGKIQLNCHVNSHGVTLQSPPHSSSQSWTLKLPDNSPTANKFLKVKSITGSGATATGQLEFADEIGPLKIDSSNNRIGIGTTSPVHDIHIHKATASSQSRIQFTTNESGTTNADGYAVAMEAGNRVYHWGYENVPMQFATNNTLNMVINADGSVSKPNNPGFYARHTTARVYNSGYLYGFTLTWEQGGSNLATATGIYTAPASGVYQVNLMLGNQYNSGGGNYKIYVNNSYYNGFTFDGIDNQTGWVTSTLCGLIKINANDTVRIYINGAGQPDNADWTAWSMYMVG